MSHIHHLTLSTTGMAFDSKTGESFQLNESAQLILQLLQQGLTLENAAHKFAEEYQISYEKALTDILEFQVQIQVIGVTS